MYLSTLEKGQKELFLDLCIILSESDGDFSETEKETIDKFCIEMNIPSRYEAKKDADTTLAMLNESCSEYVKRSLVLEIIGIVIADGKYADAEKEILIKLSKVFSISYGEIEKMIGVVKELWLIYGKFNLFMNGESI